MTATKKLFLRSVATATPGWLKPLAREIWRIVGNRDSKEALLLERTNVAQQWQSIVANSPSLENLAVNGAGQKTKVLFLTGFGIGSHYLTVEPIIISSLLVRGADVVSLYCGATLPACEFNKNGNHNPLPHRNERSGMTYQSRLATCESCSNNVKETYKNLPISLENYQAFRRPGDQEEAAQIAAKVDFKTFRQWTYEGIAVGEEAFSSFLRTNFLGTVPDTPSSRRQIERFLTSGILLVKILRRAFEKIKPDRLVLIHGVYLTHGLGVKVAKQMQIPVIVVGGGGIRGSTAILCHGETYHHQLINEPNSVWENHPLSEAEKRRVLQYASSKKNAGSSVDYLNYHPSPVEDRKSILSEIGISDDRPIVSAFTNVIWDAQIVYKSNAFVDIFDWISKTIEFAARNPKIILAIRIHPAEVKGGTPTRQLMADEIKARWPVLPENVRIIGPASDISSYTLGEMSKAAIIYGTKLGLELALMKVPLIICGESFSRNKGYGLDITSAAQYEKLFSTIHEYSTDVEVTFERAVKYAHYFYFRRMLDLPFETKQAAVVGSGKKINLQSLQDLMPGKQKSIDTICDGILELKEFVLPA